MLIGITTFNSVTTASVKLRGVESYIDKWREQILQVTKEVLMQCLFLILPEFQDLQ